MTRKQNVGTAGKKVGTGYLPTLDGWRAFAILLVILAHDRVRSVGSVRLWWMHWYGGDAGVNLFFALSGLLICSRLLQEEKLRGKISLKGFYIRRVCRIQPAAWVFLGTLSVLIWVHVMDWSWGEIWASLLLVRNYLPRARSVHAWYTLHFWSLSLEEHFYLFLPLFLVLVRRGRARILVSLVLGIELWRWFYLSLARVKLGVMLPGFHTDVNVGGIVLAAAGAVLLMRPAISEWCLRWLHPVPVLLLTVAVVWGGEVHHGRFPHLGMIVMYPLLIVSTMYHPESWMGRVLETAPMKFVGRISYSLYLWQMLFFNMFAPIVPMRWRALTYVQGTPWRYLAVVVMALASYYLVERPMMRVGHRLAKPATAGREELEPETAVAVEEVTTGRVAAEVMEGMVARVAGGRELPEQSGNA